MAAEAERPRWKERVDAFRCLKGVDTATAADLVFEAGEFSRFKNAWSVRRLDGAQAIRALQRREGAAAASLRRETATSGAPWRNRRGST